MRVGVCIAALLTLVGCPDTTEKEGDDPPPINTGDDSDTSCEGTAPELVELVVEDYGSLYPFEDGDHPALKVAGTGQDEDGDLHRMNMVLWWDDVVDGAVDTSAEGTEAGYYSMGDTPCSTGEATYAIVFEVDGSRFLFDTEYEFAAEVYDDAGLVSNQLVASGTTPSEP